MALVFCDGFDHYKTADILTKWTGFSASAVIGGCDVGSEYARPPGGMGLSLTQAGSSRGVFKTLAATHTSFVCGFAFYQTNGSSALPLVGFFDSTSGTPGGTHQLGLKLDGSGHLVIGTGATVGTVLATSTNVMSANTWYHIEIKATINNSTGTYEVRVNGSSTGWIPAATGKNTRGQSANNYIDIVELENGTAYYDDCYFLSSSAPNNDFLGPIKIATAFPSGTGNYAQWTGNFASNFTNVQELAGDGDATFNQSATAGQIDTFNMDDMPTGTILAVQDVSLARQDAGAARTFRTKFRSGSTDYSGTTVNLAGSYLYLLEPRDVDPATGSAYTVSNFNAQERGYELVS